jgi:hypothetical protein
MGDPKDTEEREREKREHQERQTEGPGDDSAAELDPAEEGVAGGVGGARATKPTG